MTFSLHKFFIAAACFAAATLLNAQGNSADSKRIGRLQADILYLASDALGGRVTGSAGEKLSADYIAQTFSAVGLKPAYQSWFQTFQITKLRIAKQQCELSLLVDTSVRHTFVLHNDFYPLNASSNNDSCEGELLDCGYGLVVRDSNARNDFAAAGDLKGKIAMIRLGYPGDVDAVNPTLAAASDINTKIREAIANGAIGILFIQGSKAAEAPKAALDRNAATFNIPIFYLKKDFLPKINVRMKSFIAAPTATGHNVVGLSKKFRKKRNTIVVCAHHDHLGLNEYGGSRYEGPLSIHNGADDNASGVAAMLELARWSKGKKLGRNNLMFVAFSGEELGLIGSKHFVSQLPVNKKKINYVINIDMLGRLDSQRRLLMINGTGTSPAWNASIEKLKIDTTQIRIAKTESGLGPSDHASFYLENIPVLHFFSGQHEDYHKPSDDENKINYSGMCRSIEVIEQIMSANNGKSKLTFTKTKDATPSARSFKVSLGVMPDYAFTGNGMKLDGVTEGKPAIKAGLQRGDIIIKVASFEVGSVQDYMQTLSKLNKGQKVEITFIRSGETKTTTAEL
jgi:hypothetical protein